MSVLHWRLWLRERLDDPDNPLGPSIQGRCAQECADYIAGVERERDEAEMALRQIVWRARRGAPDPAGWWPLIEKIATRNMTPLRGETSESHSQGGLK